MSTQILMPQLGETVTEGTITAWHRREGELVAADDALFELETDKVVTEVPAPSAGVLRRILVEAGRTVPVGTPLAEIDVPSAATHAGSVGISQATAVTGAERSATGHGLRILKESRRDSKGRPLSPAARRLIREHGIPVDQVTGTGRNGRVRRRDLLEYVRAPRTDRGGQLIPFNRLRKRIAAHMLASKASSPHVLQAVEVEFHGIDAVRAAVKESWREQYSWSLTPLPFVAHSVCRALREFPLVNASIEGDALRVHPDVNLAIAVDLNFDGLVAPVIARAQTLSVRSLARRIHELSTRARENRLLPDDLQGGTYTISNSGSFGTLITAPIINQPQVAILSLDGVRKRPVVIESPAGDAIAIRPVGVLAQSFDHRAMDGAYSAAFLRTVKRIIETADWSNLIAAGD